MGPVRAVVITGAEPLPAACGPAHVGADLVIAADGGYDLAVDAGWHVDVLVGDMDSVRTTPTDPRLELVAHPCDKDATDTELALAEAVRRGATELVVVAGGGDRLDHQLAVFGALGAAGLSGLDSVDAWWGPDRLVVVHGPAGRTIDLAPGTTFSILALHGDVGGLAVTGSRWELLDADLAAGSGHGISNLSLNPSIEVAVRSGVATVIIPGAQP